MNLKRPSLESLKTINPAAYRAWRDLSVLLEHVRTTAGQSKIELSRKSGISVANISLLESGMVRPDIKYLSAYDEAALSVDISPLDIFKAYEKAKDLERGHPAAESRFKTRERGCKMADGDTGKNTLFEEWEKGDLLELAASEPKTLLMSARWLPQRAEDRMERISFYQEFIGKVSGIKEHCINLATEAQKMLAVHKEIGKLFDTYAADLPGYALVKRQFYSGEILDEILTTVGYTRRWAQTLQERTLRIFQQRVKEQYDKRRIGA